MKQPFPATRLFNQKSLLRNHVVALPSPKAQDYANLGFQLGPSKQEIVTSEMGFSCQFALQKFRAAHGRDGSIATEKRCPLCDALVSFCDFLHETNNYSCAYSA